MKRGLEENEIRSCRMKMKLPHIENEITKEENKYSDTLFYLRRIFYSIPL